MSFQRAALFLLACSSLIMGGLSTKVNVLCMMEHCFQQTMSCYADTDCHDALSCVSKCADTNQTCMYDCLYTYEDSHYDTFMQCVVTDHHCITFTPPPFKCNPPKDYMRNISLANMTGSWWIVRGKNPNFDCFDCGNTTYVPKPNSKNFTAIEEFDVRTLDGSVVHRRAQDTVQIVPTDPGIINDYSVQMGLETQNRWRILDYGPNGEYALVYYCGFASNGWYYEGSVVYSRTPELSSDVLDKIAVVASKYGFDINDYCKPKTSGCKPDKI